MKLVMQYHWGSEDCNGTTIIPFNYESAEKAICDFEDNIKNCLKNKKSFFNFISDDDSEFMASEFVNYTYWDGDKRKFYQEPEINLPEIYTLEEWFEKECANPDTESSTIENSNPNEQWNISILDAEGKK